jgi:hypothetical protein
MGFEGRLALGSPSQKKSGLLNRALGARKGDRVAFVPSSRTFNGSLTLKLEPSEAFALFSPEGERLWVPGWQPELLHPQGSDWAEGQVFRTREEFGDAVWVVSTLDRANCHVVYYRVEAKRYVARIEVKAIAAKGSSKILVAYSFVGLSEHGNKDIEAMSQSAYNEKLRRWSLWLRTHILQCNK